jgi:hypothetical protein
LQCIQTFKMILKDFCRLCLVKSSKNSDEIFFPIDVSFEKKFKEITSRELIKPKTDEQMEQFPDKMCMSCVTALGGHYNYRTELIEKQEQLCSLLGIDKAVAEISLSPQVQKKAKTPSPVKQPVQTYEEEHAEDEFQDDEMDHEAELKQSVKIENAESDYEEYDENYDHNEYSTQENYEVVEEVDEEEHAEDAEEVNEDENDEELEAAIDQLEENYQMEDETAEFVCYVKGENAAEDEYVEYEEDIVMEEELPQSAVKRKYTKQSKETPKQFKCWMKNCGQAFAFRATMKKHMEQHHSIVCDKSTCFVCGSRFEVYAEFLSHMKEHTRKSQCDVCKLTFVDDEKLSKHKARAHMKNDVADRNFQCHVRTFSFKF